MGIALNSATANCSDSTLCEHSSSGCRGGSDTNEYCAPGLTGPFCQLCEATNASELLYYVPASETSVAGCQPCGGLAGDLLFLYALIAIGAAGVLLSLAALRRRLPKSMIAMLSRLWRATKPETKLKILFAGTGLTPFAQAVRALVADMP